MQHSLALQPPAAVGPSTGRFRRRAGIVLLAALALGAGVAFGLLRTSSGASTMPTNSAIEETWGVRITQVAPTADDGLVDFRFLVLDADKASAMVSDPSRLPILRIEGGDGVVFSAASMAAKHDLGVGRTYFVLYRNAGGAIQRGTRVTVVFPDGLELDHVVAR